jgi:hypothetical protein
MDHDGARTGRRNSRIHAESTMGQQREPKETVRIELTEEQKKALREQTGQEATAIEFSVEELEQRIAPVRITHLL